MSQKKRQASLWLPDRPDDWAKVFPLLETIRTYHAKTFQNDFIAGVTVFFTLVPQSLAYAKLAGVPPEWGLYAAAFPLLFYAIFGTSRHICTGPFAVTCYMLGDICSDYLEFFEKGSVNYIKFSLYVSFISGLMFMVMWALQLGSLVNMVTPSVNSGFITGCAMLVWFHQVPNACGFSVPHTNLSTDSLWQMLKSAKNTTAVAMWITIPTYIFLYGVMRYKRARSLVKNKNPTTWYNFVSFLLNTSYFIAFIVGYAVSRRLQSSPDSHAAKTLLIVGDVPPGIPAPIFSFPTFLPVGEALMAIPPALTLTVVAGMTNWSISKKFADQFGYSVNIQNELFSAGIVNIFGPLTNSFFCAGGLARTNIGVESGAKTQISNIVCAILVIVSLISFAPELRFIPLPTLGTITMCGVTNMIDFQKQISTYKTDKKEAAVMLVTTLCTFWLGVTQGIIIGILISLLSELYANYYPRIIPLGVSALPRKSADQLEYKMGGRALPHIAIARVDSSSLYFGNVQYVCGHLMHIARRGHEDEHKTPITVAKHFVLGHRVLIIDISSCIHIDETATTFLKDLRAALLLRDTFVAYIQGDSFYDRIREDAEKEQEEDEDGSSKRSSGGERGGDESRGKSVSMRDSILSVYKGGHITSDTTRFSTAPHIQAQLAVAGASQESKNGAPISLFAEIDQAVQYYSLFFSVKAACDLTEPDIIVTKVIGATATATASSSAESGGGASAGAGAGGDKKAGVETPSPLHSPPTTPARLL